MMNYRANLIDRPGKSGGVTRYGFDAERKALIIEFNRTSMYVYTGVSRREYDELQKAPSITGFVQQEIKPNYPYRKIPPDIVLPATEVPLRVSTTITPAFIW